MSATPTLEGLANAVAQLVEEAQAINAAHQGELWHAIATLQNAHHFVVAAGLRLERRRQEVAALEKEIADKIAEHESLTAPVGGE